MILLRNPTLTCNGGVCQPHYSLPLHYCACTDDDNTLFRREFVAPSSPASRGFVLFCSGRGQCGLSGDSAACDIIHLYQIVHLNPTCLQLLFLLILIRNLVHRPQAAGSERSLFVVVCSRFSVVALRYRVRLPSLLTSFGAGGI